MEESRIWQVAGIEGDAGVCLWGHCGPLVGVSVRFGGIECYLKHKQWGKMAFKRM